MDYWGTVFYVVMLANYDTPLIREETRPLMCMAGNGGAVRRCGLASTHDLPYVRPKPLQVVTRASGLGQVERDRRVELRLPVRKDALLAKYDIGPATDRAGRSTRRTPSSLAWRPSR